MNIGTSRHRAAIVAACAMLCIVSNVRAADIILILPLQFGFGDVRVGQCATIHVRFRNGGQDSVTISGQCVRVAGDTGVITCAAPFVLPPHRDSSLLLTYCPRHAGPDTINLLIDSFSIPITMNGNGVAPLEPCDVHFNTIQSNTRDSEIVVIRNSGAPEFVDHFAIAGPDAYAYSWYFCEPASLNFPYELGTGDSIKLWWVFHPVDVDAGDRSSAWFTVFSPTPDTIAQAVGAFAITPPIGVEQTTARHIMPQLYQSIPNPVTDISHIPFDTPGGDVDFIVTNLLGGEVFRQRQRVRSGQYTFTVDAHSLPAGNYFYAMMIGSTKLVRIMSVVR